MPGTGSSDSGEQETLFCPSAYPQMAGSKVLALVEKGSGSRHEPRVTYFPSPEPVTDEIMAAAAGATRPTNVYRFAAPCVREQCHNWSGSRCQVSERMVQTFPAVVSDLPACNLRPECRWFAEEGGAACVRCPQVITDDEGLIAAINKMEPRRPTQSALSRALSAGISQSVISAISQKFP